MTTISEVNAKLISMVILTLLITIPLISLARDPRQKRLLCRQVPRFVTIWSTFVLGTLVMRHIFAQQVSLRGLLRVVWCSGLLAAFLIFATMEDFFMGLAESQWGPWVGPAVIYAFSALWIYTVFSYYYNDCGGSIGGGSKENSRCGVPVGTQRATSFIVFMAITILYKASCGHYPHFAETLATYLEILLSWIIIFAVCFYYLMRDECAMEEGVGTAVEGRWLQRLDLGCIPWTTYWNLFLMASVVSFVVTLYRECHEEKFDIKDYYCFCLCLLGISVTVIRSLRWLDLGDRNQAKRNNNN